MSFFATMTELGVKKIGVDPTTPFGTEDVFTHLSKVLEKISDDKPRIIRGLTNLGYTVITLEVDEPTDLDSYFYEMPSQWFKQVSSRDSKHYGAPVRASRLNKAYSDSTLTVYTPEYGQQFVYMQVLLLNLGMDSITNPPDPMKTVVCSINKGQVALLFFGPPSFYMKQTFLVNGIELIDANNED